MLCVDRLLAFDTVTAYPGKPVKVGNSKRASWVKEKLWKGVSQEKSVNLINCVRYCITAYCEWCTGKVRKFCTTWRKITLLLSEKIKYSVTSTLVTTIVRIFIVNGMLLMLMFEIWTDFRVLKKLLYYVADCAQTPCLFSLHKSRLVCWLWHRKIFRLVEVWPQKWEIVTVVMAGFLNFCSPSTRENSLPLSWPPQWNFYRLTAYRNFTKNNINFTIFCVQHNNRCREDRCEIVGSHYKPFNVLKANMMQTGMKPAELAVLASERFSQRSLCKDTLQEL